MKFYAVVHVTGRSSSLPGINAERALQVGADGVFLINHGVRPSELVGIANQVHDAFPDLWIGLNLLGVRPEEAFHCMPDYTKGLWVDNACTPMYAGDGVRFKRADNIRQARVRSEWKGEYFGGVAFKYQPQPDDLKDATMRAADYVDVVTTSGEGTGRAPVVQKIATMREALGPQKGLAIASGITPENVKDFMPYASHILVATGISKSFDELDLDRMKMLVDVVRSR